MNIIHDANLLPDFSSADQKSLMWSNTTAYMCDSGYSTTAPSLSGFDAQDNSSITTNTIINNINSNDDDQLATAAASTNNPTEETNTDDEFENNVANWMVNKDCGELALKAIPDLVKLLNDEDIVVVKEAAVVLSNMSRVEASRVAITKIAGTVESLVSCLMMHNDLELAKILAGTIYSISTQKPHGIESIINSKAMYPLAKLLSVPDEAVVSYAITTIHNVLLDCNDDVKNYLRQIGAIQFIVPLLDSSPNVKLLSVVVDCLQLLAFQHSESKLIILQFGGLQMLMPILQHSDYQKLLLNTTRLLKVLSCCSQNKQALIAMNAVQLLTAHLNTNNYDILTNVLVTLRNLSDAAIKLNDLAKLIKSLLAFLSTSKDMNILVTAAGILSNLTCNNELNKKTAVNCNAVQILLNKINSHVFHAKLVDPCLCTLKHITNKHQDALLAQEQFRSINGLAVITELMRIEPRNWMVIKAALGLLRNFCSNPQNVNQIRENCLIEKLMQVLFEAYQQIQMSGEIKLNDTKLTDIIDSSSAALMILAKDPQNQLLMKQLDCIPFFVQMFFSHSLGMRKAAAILLAELSASMECALDMEQQPGLMQFIHDTYFNQFTGQLKTIADFPASSEHQHTSVILRQVFTIVQKVNEYRQQMMQKFNYYQYAQQIQQQQQKQFQ